MPRRSLSSVLVLSCLLVPAAFAKTPWNVAEPTFPTTCKVLYAPLISSANGPILAGSSETPSPVGVRLLNPIQYALNHCLPKHAVELAPTATAHSFLLDPITLPPGVSLIVDGGVTVYGTTMAARYQITPSLHDVAAGIPKCGTIGNYAVYAGCKPLISLGSGSGVYGYGIIDGQGDQPIIGGNGDSWWKLISHKDTDPACKRKTCQEASPLVISVGSTAGTSSDMTLDKITIRNPPFHTIRLAGSNITVWDVKVQAPWNVPNTDGFDVHGHNILIEKSIVANGDQDVALTSAKEVTHDVLIDGLRAYGKGGIALLDDGPGFAKIDVDDFAMTGDLPSVETSSGTVNGVSQSFMQSIYQMQNYGQALPNATQNLKGLQINTDLNSNTLPSGRSITGITFKSVCIADVEEPVHIGPLATNGLTHSYPLISGIIFQDLRVLPPGSQFLAMRRGIPEPSVLGTYKLTLVADSETRLWLNFKDIVFGNGQPPGNLIFDSIDAERNTISANGNVYPVVLDALDGHATDRYKFVDNIYTHRASSNVPEAKPSCPADTWPFVTGELYAGKGVNATKSDTNLQVAKTTIGATVTLYAVVQPTMSQATNFMPGSYNQNPGLLAVGSPPLSGTVTFYEGQTLLGSSKLGGNGTLAQWDIKDVGPGQHIYRAVYEDDPAKPIYYQPLDFGHVTVLAH
jgi:hypothetical protein